MEWQASHKKSFLSSAFLLSDTEHQEVWQLGYYNQNHTISTFVLQDDHLDITEDQEIFKKDETKVSLLDINKVKVDSDVVLQHALSVVKEHYPAEVSMKTIVVLQNLKGKGVYSLTFLTKSLKTITLRIDAFTGEVVSEEVRNLMDFRSQ